MMKNKTILLLINDPILLLHTEHLILDWVSSPESQAAPSKKQDEF